MNKHNHPFDVNGVRYHVSYSRRAYRNDDGRFPTFFTWAYVHPRGEADTFGVCLGSPWQQSYFPQYELRARLPRAGSYVAHQHHDAAFLSRDEVIGFLKADGWVEEGDGWLLRGSQAPINAKAAVDTILGEMALRQPYNGMLTAPDWHSHRHELAAIVAAGVPTASATLLDGITPETMTQALRHLGASTDCILPDYTAGRGYQGWSFRGTTVYFPGCPQPTWDVRRTLLQALYSLTTPCADAGLQANPFDVAATAALIRTAAAESTAPILLRKAA